MSMDIIKKTAAVTVLALAAVVFTACSEPPEEKSPTFCFSCGDGDMTEQLVSVAEDEIYSYKSVYADAAGGYFGSQLEGNELYVYNAVAYATDNAYTCIYIPQGCYDEDINLTDVITFYSCDSPILEHNYTENGKFTLSSVIAASGENKDEKYYTFNLPRNAAEYTRKKQLAYEEAKRIVDTMPASVTSELDKARYLYDYVTNNVTFTDGFYDLDTVPVYDALLGVKKATICDGFADTLMMLFNLAGIPSFTVEGTADGGGHVLTAAKVDGQYYYFDASADSIACASGFKGRFYFSMSGQTAFSTFVPEIQFTDLLPSCPVDGVKKSAEAVVIADTDEAVTEVSNILLRDGSALVDFADTMSEFERSVFAQRVVSVTGKGVIRAEYNGLTGYVFQ